MPDSTTVTRRWQRRNGRFIPGQVRLLISIDSGGDPWGETMSHAFGISTSLYANHEEIPWDFRTPRDPEQERESVEDLWPDSEYLWMLETGQVTAEQLRRSGMVLNRYLDRLKAAGRDY